MASKVIVNGRCLPNPTTGVERYTREIARWLGENIQIVGIDRSRRGVRGHVWEQMQLPFLLRKDDVLWSPANSGPLAVSRQVVTIHDLSPLENPSWYRPAFSAWYGYLLPRLAMRSAKIITDSYYSKIRIQELFRISPSKVDVAPCGVDTVLYTPQPDEECNRVLRKYKIHAPYGLFVGSLQPRKNVQGLIKAWNEVASKIEGYLLVLAGGTGNTFPGLDMDRLPDRVKWIGYVEERDLPGLYTSARSFMLPSFYEGFGLTALESMACGTPVVVSNVTALPEVVGEAGLLVDPYDPKQLACAIERLIVDDELHRELSVKGLQRAQQYKWRHTAGLILQALKDASLG